MEPMGSIYIKPSSLSVKDLPWQIHWDKEKCTLCGRCTSVCPVRAIELGVFRKRIVNVDVNDRSAASNVHTVYYGIKQQTDVAPGRASDAPCAIWFAPIAPSILFARMKWTSCGFTSTRAVSPGSGAGRRNSPGGLLDQIKFTRISMLTDPALDAGRHEFELRTPFGPCSVAGRNAFSYTRARMEPSGSGDLPTDHRQHVVRRPLSHHVGRLADGHRVSQRRAGHAEVRYGQWRGRSPAPFLEVAVLEIYDSADRERVFRLGRNTACHSENERGSLRNRDQIRAGRQAGRWRVADVVQGEQAYFRHQGRTRWGQPSQPTYASDQNTPSRNPWQK